MDFPSQDRFWRCIEDSLGSADADVLRGALQTPPSVSVRRNPSKISEEELTGHFKGRCRTTQDAARTLTERVPWCAEGLYLAERPLFTLDPMLHCGAYYVQDASSMFTGELFRRAARGMGGRLRVLDLCAAPGGKSTHVAAILRSAGKGESLVVSNEVSAARVNALAENTARWGEPNVAVTNSDPACFGRLPRFFDIILVDAPCSGEGMFRKDAEAAAEWSEESVKLCAARQKRILGDVWPALREGGILIYSTCTYNKYENDGNVEWMVAELGAETEDVGPIPEGAFRTGSGGVQFLPGRIRGEGQFAAMLMKTGDARLNNRTVRGRVRRTEGKSAVKCGYVRGDLALSMRGDLLKAVPESIAEELAVLETAVKVVRSGVAVATVKGGSQIPEYDLAHLNPEFLVKEAFGCAEISEEEAVKYLKRDNLTFPDRPKGYILLTCDKLPLGFVNNLGNRSNNLMPVSRRIRL